MFYVTELWCLFILGALCCCYKKIAIYFGFGVDDI